MRTRFAVLQPVSRVFLLHRGMRRVEPFELDHERRAPSTYGLDRGRRSPDSAGSTTASAAPPHKPRHFATRLDERPRPGDVHDPAGRQAQSAAGFGPAYLAVQLTVVSGDGHAHRVVLMTPSPRTLSVPAGGRASVLIGGQRVGHYPIEVDGTAAGRSSSAASRAVGTPRLRRSASRRRRRGRAQQHDALVLVERAEHQHLGGERADPARREVDDADDQRALELLARVVA